MPSQQGDLTLLNEPVAQELLQSTIPARLAYVSRDSTPRVVPIWFHWTGEVFVLGTPPTEVNDHLMSRNLQTSRTLMKGMGLINTIPTPSLPDGHEPDDGGYEVIDVLPDRQVVRQHLPVDETP